MKSYKDIEDKMMHLRLPLPQQRLALARSLRRAATRVGHHHFAELTEVACGRIEAEMVPKENDRPKRQRRKLKRGEKRKQVDGEGEAVEEREREKERGKEREDEEREEGLEAADGVGDEQENQGFVFSQEDGERMEDNLFRHAPGAGNRLPVEENLPQQREDQRMRRRFGEYGGDSKDPEERQPRRSSRHRESLPPSRRPREHEGRARHGRRKHYNRHGEHKHHRRKHNRKSSQSPLPARSKLNWKVLLKGFITGVVEYEMKKTPAEDQANTQEVLVQRPSSRRDKIKATNPKSRSPSPGPSRPQLSGSLENRERLPSPGPSRGRTRQRRQESDPEPALTPGQVHWREVRAREQGQDDMMHAEEAHHHEEPLAYGKTSFADPAPGPALKGMITAVPLGSLLPETATPGQNQPVTQDASLIVQAQPELFGSGWAFPSTLAVSAQSAVAPSTTQGRSSSLIATTQTVYRAPTEAATARWGDPIKQMEKRQERK